MIASDLGQPVVLSLIGGGFVAAFLHAALPTHWLPFVLVGRAQGWSLGQVLGAVAVAGLAHVTTTAAAGGLIVMAGLALSPWIGSLLPHLAAALLFLFGAFYLIRASLRRPALAGGPAVDMIEPTVSHAAAFWGLVALMALSPGEVLLPVYVSAASEGPAVLAALTLAFAAGAVLGMAILTVAARAGASMLRLERWTRYEGLVLGVALIALGLLMLGHMH